MKKKIDIHLTMIRNSRKHIQKALRGIFGAGDSDRQNEWMKCFVLGTEKKTLKDLKMAVIMDRFTLECFRPECQLIELTPEGWDQEMKEFQPDLLFIESAWEGKDGLWHGKVNHCSTEVYDLTEYCHEQNIPVVFWNKEDPVFTDTFIPTAKRADIVFTTDLECVEKYKFELEHDRVYHLHFAAQPHVHNPIEKYERKDRFCFAGAYYHRYQERCRVFDAFSDYFINSRGLDIFDRNYLNARPEHKFPERYDPYILGKLDPSEIDIAYKGYVYGVNMNSITQSQTMFARRVFELMASNTLVVGNYSRGVKNYFGDLTFCTDDEKTLRAGLERYCADLDSTDKLRLLALRKVLAEHLVEDRLDYIIQKVFGRSIKRNLPLVTVYSYVDDQKMADRVISMFLGQVYGAKKLLLVSDADLCVPDCVCVMTASDFSKSSISKLCGEGYLAYFCTEDWYGKNYLLDLALTTRYGTFDAIGKADYFENSDGTPVRKRNNLAYHKVAELAARRCMVNEKLYSGLTGEDLNGDRVWIGTDFMSVDSMNYCEFWPETSCAAAEDVVLADQGISLKEMEQAARNVKPVESYSDTFKVDVDTISKMKIGKADPVRLERQGNQLRLISELPDGVHRYFYLNEKFNVDPYLEDASLGVLFRGEARMNLTGFCLFYDKANRKLDSKSFKIGVRGKVCPPSDTAYMRIAYRASGSGSAVLRDAEFGTNIVSSLRGGCFLSRSNVLVLSNHYPAPDDLYRNMFVHKRLTAYKDQGALVDMMRMNPYARNVFREFEGINVIEGQGDMLASILANGTIDTVCVHFLDEHMWEVLKNHLGSIRVMIWLHGAEIQPWWRREYNFTTKEQLEDAKIKSDKRMAFWREVFEASKTANMQFVFVSRYFADEVLGDYKITLPEGKCYIVHNCIDTEQFTYVPKKAEDRKKLLSIRPYASNKYANDLTVKAILELKKEPWFHELEIALYGSGTMFEETLEPLKGIPNIHMEKRFFTQSEIAALHKEYGIFLTPTRMDAQGVSRDEAMSSGLVPVTNAVTAIPEFVSEDCGILAAGEDYIGMAEGIKRMYHNPDLFQKLSENAAKRVRSQTSREHTIDVELQMIFPDHHSSNRNADGISVGTESKINSSDEECHPSKLSIFGSCVSRDCIRIAPDNRIQLCSYIARQSVISAVSAPVPLEMDAIRLDSAFQKRAVWQDFNKVTFQMLEQDGSEWLLIDLVDERFPLVSLGGSYVTKSGHAVESGIVARDQQNLHRLSNGKEYYFEKKPLKNYIEEFCRRLLKIYSPDHIIIHRAFATDHYISADGTVHTYRTGDNGSDKILNDLIRYMYDVIKTQIPQAHEIDCSEKYCGSENHIWGISSAHYVDDYYKDVMFQLADIICNQKLNPDI